MYFQNCKLNPLSQLKMVCEGIEHKKSNEEFCVKSRFVESFKPNADHCSSSNSSVANCSYHTLFERKQHIQVSLFRNIQI